MTTTNQHDAGTPKKKSAARTWAYCIAVDVGVFACMYFWWAHGNEGAQNIVVAYSWFFAAVMFLIGVTTDKSNHEKHPRPAGFATYHAITTALLFAGLAYLGHPVLAVVTLATTLIYESSRVREPKQKGGAA